MELGKNFLRKQCRRLDRVLTEKFHDQHRTTHRDVLLDRLTTLIRSTRDRDRAFRIAHVTAKNLLRSVSVSYTHLTLPTSDLE
mgnify:CR=1 FL=1